jgi:ribosomal protein S18 acetylase RimI-like enzyme
METIVYRRSDWDELDGNWQALVRENYHPFYNGMGENYTGIATAEEKIENMKPYVIGIPAWGAWVEERLVGVIMGKITGDRLVIFDFFVSTAFRRQGIGRRLLEMAIQESGARTIAAEVNRENTASQALFHSLSFQRRVTADWLVLDLLEQEDPRKR